MKDTHYKANIFTREVYIIIIREQYIPYMCHQKMQNKIDQTHLITISDQNHVSKTKNLNVSWTEQMRHLPYFEWR